MAQHYSLTIDGGTTQSAYVVCDLIDNVPVPVSMAKVDNDKLRLMLLTMVLDQSIMFDTVVIEKVVSYGASVGQDVFTTCEWNGRFYEILSTRFEVFKISRRVVKATLSDNKAKTDAQLKHIIVDRYAPQYSNHGKGTKANPSMFYNMKADMWQAYAIAVTVHDINDKEKLRDYTVNWG